MPYPRYREPCGWQSLLIRRCPEPALRDHVDCDLAVVGAGYTGLAAARTWAEARPADRVAVLDASVVGEGSPGRNSGFMLDIALADDADPRAVSRMRACNVLLRETMDGLRGLVKRHRIRCGLTRTGTFRGAATARGVRYLGRYRAFLDAAGLEYQELGADALERRIGTRYYSYALYSPDCSLVQPAALIRGLADSLPLNVQLYEETPALALAREGTFWRIECPDGTVRARHVVLANNAFARELAAGVAPHDGAGPRRSRGRPHQRLHALLHSRLTVMYTYAGLTAPLPGRLLKRLGHHRTWGLLPAHRLGTTLRRTADGRLMVRSHYGYEREEDNVRVAGRLRDCLTRRFPELALDHRRSFEHVWGGATGFTYNGAPVWGAVEPGLWISAGCNGGGVVKGTLFGTLLAQRALGRDTADVAGLFGRASWMPPEPLRRLGFALRSTIERRHAGLET